MLWRNKNALGRLYWTFSVTYFRRIAVYHCAGMVHWVLCYTDLLKSRLHNFFSSFFGLFTLIVGVSSSKIQMAACHLLQVHIGMPLSHCSQQCLTLGECYYCQSPKHLILSFYFWRLRGTIWHQMFIMLIFLLKMAKTVAYLMSEQSWMTVLIESPPWSSFFSHVFILERYSVHL